MEAVGLALLGEGIGLARPGELLGKGILHHIIQTEGVLDALPLDPDDEQR